MIRWIRPQLGTAAYGQIGEGEYVVVDVRHLVDKSGNPSVAIAELVNAGVSAYRAGKVVVVACDFGVSRSNAIAAGILSVAERLPYEDALAEVTLKTGETEIKLDVAFAVERAVQENSSLALSDRRSVLVTGGSGFIGSRLLSSIDGEFRAFAPHRTELDLRGATAVDAYCQRNGVGQLVHLAYPRVYTNVNAAGESITMLRCILDVCRHRGIRLIFVSGAVVFAGYNTSGMNVDELTPLRPKGVYGESKYLEEQLVHLYASRGDIDATVCRLGAVYGPRGTRPRFIRTFYEAALGGEKIATHRFRNGPPKVDLLYIDDAVRALAAVLGSSLDGILHFGGGEQRTTADLAKSIAKLAGTRAMQSEIAIDDFTSNVALDSTKATRLLGWKPSISLDEGLRRTLAFANESP